MDFNSITSLASEQGPVFWAAAAAVSLGLTLLVVASLQSLRRLIGNRRPVQAAVSVAPPAEEIPAADAATRPTATPETAQGAYEATTVTATPSNPENSSMALLLRRLQSAGDRLEEIASDLDTSAALAHDSLLKSEPRDVEYVFRASGS